MPLPPRLSLAGLLVALYEKDTDASRAALIDIIRRSDLRFGLWGGLKRIYKLAEARHDAELFGVLAWRFDVERGRGGHRREVSGGTLTYLRRRAWRYLRHLGAEVETCDDGLAARGQQHPAAGAFEQREAERLLQLADLGAQRRLADGAAFGGAAEMAQFGDRDDIFQVTQGQAGEIHR